MREKLIELLDGWDCPILLAVCEAESLADYLIANGVGFVTDNNVGSKWFPTALGFYPEKGGDYLCLCCIDGHTEYPFYMVLRYYIVDKNPHFQHESEHGLKVTHWMCLPDMPKDGDT